MKYAAAMCSITEKIEFSSNVMQRNYIFYGLERKYSISGHCVLDIFYLF